jgi:ABC-2 type transport system ATP-binding protein
MTSSLSAGTPAVRAEGLVKVFGDNRAVDGVDLTVEAGTVYGVLGPNGAGKTTTIRMLATLLRADGGRAEIFGHDVEREAQIVRQLVGVTGQYASVDETLSATENLVLFGRLLGLSRSDARRKAVELLEEFGLTDAAKRPLKNFSGGMRRRLDLAASLIARPPLIFLDEPTTGLDPRTRAQMWDTIRSLVAGGSTVLLTTQYLDEADQLADRIAVIDTGKVVAEGTSDELKASVGTSSLQLRPEDPADLELVRAAVERVLRVPATVSPEAARLTAPMQNPDLVTDLLVALRDADVRLSELSVQKPTLDEVFLTLTGHGVDNADTREEAELERSLA